MSADLKPCPFCGSDNIDSDHGAWGVICNQCDATGPGRCHHDTSYWNTRAPDPAVAVLEAEVARLREVLQYWIDWLVDGAQVGSQLSKASTETIRLMATLPAPADRITELEAEVDKLKSELEKLNAPD